MLKLELIAFLSVIPIALLIGFFWASAGAYPATKYNEIVHYDRAPTSGATDSADRPAPDAVVNPAQNGSPILTVISYNIGYLSGLANAAGGNTSIAQTQQFFADNLQQAIKALQSENPDFIGLQEIDLASKRSYFVNQVKALAEALGLRSAAIGVNWDANYVPFPVLPVSAHFGRTLAAQAILSRYPVQTSDRIVLEQVKSQPFYYRAFYLDRIAQVARIDVEGKPLILINVHLEAFDQPTRLNQTQVVKTLAETYAAQYPVLLIGDFNSALTRSESEPSINLLLNSHLLRSAVSVEQLRDRSRVTFPSDQPQNTLDYVFYNPDRIEVIETQVVQTAAQASDHLPILARVRLR